MKFFRRRQDSEHSACAESVLICLNPNELEILDVLGREGTITMSRLRDISGLAMSTITGIVDRLVTMNLIFRRRHEEDRRVVMVELSGAGGKALAERYHARGEVCRKVLSVLSPRRAKRISVLFWRR